MRLIMEPPVPDLAVALRIVHSLRLCNPCYARESEKLPRQPDLAQVQPFRQAEERRFQDTPRLLTLIVLAVQASQVKCRAQLENPRLLTLRRPERRQKGRLGPGEVGRVAPPQEIAAPPVGFRFDPMLARQRDRGQYLVQQGKGLVDPSLPRFGIGDQGLEERRRGSQTVQPAKRHALPHVGEAGLSLARVPARPAAKEDTRASHHCIPC